MKFEARASRHEKRIRSWHRKYAWLPTTIDGTTVWLGHYWRRFAEVRINTRHGLQFALTCMLLGKRCGQWEWSVERPETQTNVVQFKKVSW